MTAGFRLQQPEVFEATLATHVAVLARDELDGRRTVHVLEDEGFRVSVVHELTGSLDELTPEVLVLTGEGATVAAGGSMLQRRTRELPMVVVSRYDGRGAILEALAAGANGFVPEDEVEQRLGPTVRAVRAGQLAIPAEYRVAAAPPILSPRERQVMAMVVLGFSNVEVANKLHVTETTVKSHLSSAYRKLGVRSRHEATSLILANKHLGLGILSLSADH
jgi:DNA-binding NarL/FixJ family response regulator